jgi:YHS domain-containing protein
MAQAIDPVCGMTVDTTTATFTPQYQGETIYFCAPGCKKAFEQNPSSYLAQGLQGQEQQMIQRINHPKESSAQGE